MSTPLLTPAEVETAGGRARALRDELSKVLLDQDAVVTRMVVALLARGHVLLEGLPGLGKTELCKGIAKLLDLPFKRIQFTPDLLPGDITGTYVLEGGLDKGFTFRPGPVFASVVLSDEINRASPKTQSALLEAMQERRVTVLGTTHVLPDPFFVLATQNPIEQEGTYPLPEAQLDRFLFEVLVDYPTLEEENRVVEQHSFSPLERLQPVLTREEVLSFRHAIAQVPAAPNVIDYAVRLVRATRPSSNGEAPEYIKRWIRWGASPRASQYLILAGRARAACDGRFNVACEDVAALAPLVLRHRLIRTFQADAEGKTTDEIIAQLLQDVAAE
jgi:MoxR-like ATPase